MPSVPAIPSLSPDSITPPDPGYQTPTEESHRPFFTPIATPTVHTPTVQRPAFIQRPSYSRRDPEQGYEGFNGAANGNRDGNGNGNGSPVGGRNGKAKKESATSSSLNYMLHRSKTLPRVDNVSIKDRLACYQWTFFTMTMATGGMANVLYVIPYKGTWIDVIGVCFFLFNLVLFVLNCIFITMRFVIHRGTFILSFTDQVESLFIPSFFVSMGTIFINICQYGVPHAGPWLLRAMEIMFWIYIVLSIVASAGLYLILWSTLIFPIHMMTPTWVFPAYPMLLTAPFAGNLITAARATGDLAELNTAAIALCAITAQGTGCLIALMISAAFIYRLMTQKLPKDFQRPGVFISIGPFGFTVAGIVQLGMLADDIIPANFLGAEHAASICKVMSVMVGLWLWGLSFWFFLVSVGSLWKYAKPNRKMPFRMTWWSFVFPNTALVTATEALGNAFESEGLKIFGCVLAGGLIIVWIIVFATMLKCFKNKELLWPKEKK